MHGIKAQLEELAGKGLLRSLRHYERTPHGKVHDGSQELWNFAANDYLGLSTHPQIAAAYITGIQEHGIGAGASRLVSGGSPVFSQFEQELATAKKQASALFFSSGYAAAVGTIPALVGKNDFIILDKLSHACLIDGSKLSGATIRVFPHNDVEKLNRLLGKIRATQPAASRILVITESVFSMDGDLCPLAEIVACKNQYDATLLLDEAHGFGVLGENGGGLAEQLKLTESVDIHMGTLSKAAGLAGGFIASSQHIIDLLINRARSFIYSTAPPPALVAAARTALAIIRSAEGHRLRTQLHTNAAHFCKILGASPSPSAIIPLVLGDNHRALRAAETLRHAGFLVPAIRYPTVPPNTARLRISLSAAHPPSTIAELATIAGTQLH